jgi:transcription elongation factor SPT5
MFMLRCRKLGYERRAVLTLLQKSFDLKARGVDIGILSAVAPEHLRGMLYIEAYSASQVEQAICGLDLIASYNDIKPVALDEMTDVL